jgi:hypothetical protein
MCTPDPSFRVRSLDVTVANCVQSPNEEAGGAGDQRGVLVVSGSTVLYSGDSSTVWLPNDTINAVTAINRIHDAMVSDIRSGTAYFLANMAGAEPTSGAGGMMTQLIELTDQGLPVVPARAIQLSQPIPLLTNQLGFYSGYGRIIIWTGSPGGAWYQIAMPSGMVTRLAGMTAPTNPNGCESWAHSGIAEFFGGEQYVVFMGNSGAGTGLIRQRISNGMTTLVQATATGDVCSIGISPTRNRWYSQYEAAPGYAPQMAGEHVVMCPAVWEAP